MKLKHRDHKENRLNGKKGQKSDIQDPDDSFLAHPLVQLPKKKESISIRPESLALYLPEIAAAKEG